MPEKKRFYGWKLVAVLFILDFINMGFPYYGGSIINGYMIHDIVMSRSTLGWGFTILNLFVGIAAIFVAMSIVKYRNPRHVRHRAPSSSGLNALFLGFFGVEAVGTTWSPSASSTESA